MSHLEERVAAPQYTIVVTSLNLIYQEFELKAGLIN